jgi:phage shock protein PspC (stress-responsive transcriptional regulator)
VNETSSGTSPGAAPGSPPPPIPGSPPRPPLRRPREGRLIAGVAAGVAEHVGMDVAIVRILFVVATIFTSGVGVAAYALAWILIPEPAADQAGAASTPARRELGGRDPLFWVGIGTLVIGVVWLMDRGGGGFVPFAPWLRPDGGLLIPLVLIAFGIALWRASDDRRRSTVPGAEARPSAPPVWSPTAPAAPARGSTQESTVNQDPSRPTDPEAGRDTVTLPPGREPLPPPPGADAGGEPGTLPPPGFSPPPGAPTAQGGGWTPPPTPPREGSILVRSTVGLALVTAGVLWMLRVADVLSIGTGRILAAALLVVGLGLLVGTVVGRGRGLIGVGLVLLPIVVVAELLHPLDFELGEYRQGVGDHTVVPASIDELEPSYQLGAGSFTLDLSEVEFTGQRRVSVQVGFGEAIIRVPDDVSVEITGQIAGGELSAFGRTSSGLGVDRSIVDEVEDASGRLILDVQVAFGEASVSRVPAAAGGTFDR